MRLLHCEFISAYPCIFCLNRLLIIRFPDVLKHRLESLQSAFDSAMRMQSYESYFQGVYPVKCNQDRYVVENIVEFGKPYAFGLEAGSKPELLLAMASMCKASPKALLVCNGYKDEEYISLALAARRLNFNRFVLNGAGTTNPFPAWRRTPKTMTFNAKSTNRPESKSLVEEELDMDNLFGKRGTSMSGRSNPGRNDYNDGSSRNYRGNEVSARGGRGEGDLLNIRGSNPSGRQALESSDDEGEER